MGKVYAFTDESGAFGWDFSKSGVSSHFVIASIIVKEEELQDLSEKLEIIRKSFFGSAEMKSKSIGKDSRRRKRLLGELVNLPFSIYAVVVEKKLMDYDGLHYKPSFYKFINNILHKELRRAFENLVVTTDEIGGSEYMQSFSAYFQKKSDIPDLFNNAKFYYERSDNNVCIQLADIIAGSIARKYDHLYENETDRDFVPIFRSKVINIAYYPKTIETYKLDESPITENYDKKIAEICLRQAALFLKKEEKNNNLEVEAQKFVLDYMLFRFMNNDLRSYIPTKELINRLEKTAFGRPSTQKFRNRIIAKLRDNGVIIASSSNGYKIPSKVSELYDFIGHGITIIGPMLSRLKSCRQIIKMGTINELDIFDKIEDESIRQLLKDNF